MVSSQHLTSMLFHKRNCIKSTELRCTHSTTVLTRPLSYMHLLRKIWDLRKNYIKHKKCASVFCVTFVRNIPYANKYLVTYAHKCLQVSMWYPLLLFGFNRNLNGSTYFSRTCLMSNILTIRSVEPGPLHADTNCEASKTKFLQLSLRTLQVHTLAPC
jgi:hypothetical protein